jgi:hypothetical protein
MIYGMDSQDIMNIIGILVIVLGMANHSVRFDSIESNSIQSTGSVGQEYSLSRGLL